MTVATILSPGMADIYPLLDAFGGDPDAYYRSGESGGAFPVARAGRSGQNQNVVVFTVNRRERMNILEQMFR